MFLCKFLILLVILSCVWASGHKPDLQPVFIVKPQGIKVTIPHVEGINSILFRGNISRPSHRFQPSEIENCFHRNLDNWTFTDPKVKLISGDKIHYLLFVQYNSFTFFYLNKEFQFNGDYTCDEDGTTDRMLLNLTKTVHSLRQEIDSLKETSLILRDLVAQHYNTSTILKLHGPLTKDNNNLVMDVQNFLIEKLDIYIKVKNATEKKSGGVEFQVATLDDKVTILKTANKKLKHSDFLIT